MLKIFGLVEHDVQVEIIRKIICQTPLSPYLGIFLYYFLYNLISSKLFISKLTIDHSNLQPWQHDIGQDFALTFKEKTACILEKVRKTLLRQSTPTTTAKTCRKMFFRLNLWFERTLLTFIPIENVCASSLHSNM